VKRKEGRQQMRIKLANTYLKDKSEAQDLPFLRTYFSSINNEDEVTKYGKGNIILP
jgi:hypothetical protein